jgi:hypothetical protein
VLAIGVAMAMEQLKGKEREEQAEQILVCLNVSS